MEQQYNGRRGHGKQHHQQRQWQHMEANFTHPVLVGDTIEIQIWKDNINHTATETQQFILYFRVLVLATQKVALDKGVAVLTITTATTRTQSKL
eukprot:scaffold1048_cov90-Amphora_coffeaeformis.AAC.26